MKTQIVLVTACLLNILLFIFVGIEVANISHEQAALEGMTQLVYASISYVDYLMSFSWLVILVAILKSHRDLFIASCWGYLGLYICDVIISHHMAIEADDSYVTSLAIMLLFIQLGIMKTASRRMNNLQRNQT